MRKIKSIYNNKCASRRLSVSDKLMGEQRVQIKLGGSYVWGDVKKWIHEQPQLVYRHVYESKKYNLRRLQLTSDCIKLLKDELKKSHPELLKRIIQNKTRKNILKRLRKEQYLKQNKK